MASLATVATIASLVGGGITAAGTIAAGRQASANANFEAAQLDEQAKEETAASQREALQAKRKTNFLLSRQQAVASASGFGALDPTVLQLAGDVAQEGAYQEGIIRYGGEQRARGLRGQADATRATGDAQKRGSFFSAAGSLASSFGSLFSKYGSGMPGDEDLTSNDDYFYGSSYSGLT